MRCTGVIDQKVEAISAPRIPQRVLQLLREGRERSDCPCVELQGNRLAAFGLNGGCRGVSFWVSERSMMGKASSRLDQDDGIVPA